MESMAADQTQSLAACTIFLPAMVKVSEAATRTLTTVQAKTKINPRCGKRACWWRRSGDKAAEEQ